MPHKTTAIERFSGLCAVAILGAEVSGSKMKQTVYFTMLVKSGIGLCKRYLREHKEGYSQCKALHAWLSYEAAVSRNNNCG